ncbi:MAG: hypothetical protein AAFQ82_16915, partial [Myxococcota bacterium]
VLLCDTLWQEKTSGASFIEVARAEPDDEDDLGTNVSGVPAGARILFPKDKGVAVPWDPKLRVVDTKDVLAVIEETDAIM